MPPYLISKWRLTACLALFSGSLCSDFILGWRALVDHCIHEYFSRHLLRSAEADWQQATYSSHPILNLLFAIAYGLCAWFYTIGMIEDPGYIPKLGSRAQQKAVIDELLGLWKFDDQNFCVHCMIRKPLRSKHCRRCVRCVAKHDQ